MIPMLRTLFGLTIGWLVSRVLWVLVRLHVVQTPEAKRVTRRSFVRNAALGSVLLNLGLLSGGFVRFFWPNKTGAFGGEINVGAALIPPVGGEPYKDVAGKFYVVHNEDGLLALYWKCPHLGCTVPWIAGQQAFICPCHGSIYDYNGVRTAGPAPRPMDLMTVAVQPNGDVVVDTSTTAITQRGDYEPSQAVGYTA